MSQKRNGLVLVFGRGTGKKTRKMEMVLFYKYDVSKIAHRRQVKGLIIVWTQS